MIDLYYCGRITGVNRAKRFIKNIVEIFVEINEKRRDVEEEGKNCNGDND